MKDLRVLEEKRDIFKKNIEKLEEKFGVIQVYRRVRKSL
jgi:hypothetical protein